MLPFHYQGDLSVRQAAAGPRLKAARPQAAPFCAGRRSSCRGACQAPPP